MPRVRKTPIQTRLLFGLEASQRLSSAEPPSPTPDFSTKQEAKSAAPKPALHVLTVTQCNQKAKSMLERHFTDVDVEGEISNFRPDRSGHCWFALKDAGGVLSAVLFRREAARLTKPLADGLHVVATGTLTIYPATGRYQLVIRKVRLAGAGALQAAFEELRKRLAAEGLFDVHRKRRLPLVPARVAVVTSAQGAVLQDILKVGLRRWSNASILLVPVRVQGPESALEVAQAITRVGVLRDALKIDVLIIARGGGSIEDLWGFNDERVARALSIAPLPTVSAIGHESDTTIADWVADVRAPTPSVAAELVFPERAVLIGGLNAYRARLTQGLTRVVARAQFRLRAARALVGDGKRALWPERQRLATLEYQLERMTRQYLALNRVAQIRRERRLVRQDPQATLIALKARLHAARARLVQGGPRVLNEARRCLEKNRMHLLALSPLEVLGRGYSITLAQDGTAIRDANALLTGQKVSLRFAVGTRIAEVLSASERLSGDA